MGEFNAILSKCLDFLKIPMHIYGFTFSFWDAWIWSIVMLPIIVLIGVVVSGSVKNKKGK